MYQLDHLDLVELVHADETAGVTTVGARFGAEAGAVGGHLDGQLLLVEDLVTGHVGERHFGGRDEGELAHLAFVFPFPFDAGIEEILGELGQLAGAVQAVRVDQIGHVALGVAVLQGVQVQHELGQGAVQTGNLALHHHEAGAGELDAVLEVDALGRFTQIDVIAHREAELARGTPAAHFHVVVLVTAHRRGLARQVGDGVGNGFQLGQQGIQLDLAGFQLVVDLGHFGLERGNIFTTTGSFTDGFGAGVALGLQLLGTGLQILAFLFQSIDSRYV